jgi:hypothetical protein
MNPVLCTIRSPQLVCHIHTPHMSGVLEVDQRSHNILLLRSISPRHYGYRHARIANRDCVGG